jgi:HK97 family phage portal protein
MILNRAIRNAKAMMRAQEWGDSSIPPNSLAGSHLGGSTSGQESAALAISAVLSCVKVLHDDVTVMPFGAYQGDKNGPRRISAVQPQIVVEPFGPELPPTAGFGQIVVSKAMRGNAYLYVTSSDSLGFPTSVAVLHPDAVMPKREVAGPNKGQKFFQVSGEKFSTSEIIHITGMMPPGAISGIDVLTAQRVNLDLAQKVGMYAEGFFGGGGSPAGVISVKGPGDRKKARAVKDAWEAGHSGVMNAHRPAVLFGDATWTPMSVTPENAQFLQTRRFLREEICGMFGVPLQRIQAIIDNASQGGGKGLDSIDQGYVTHTILPLVIGIEGAWDRMIPGGASTWTRFDVDGFLRAAAKERADIALIYRTTGIRTPDEIRADEGWEPLPDGKGSDPNAPLNSNVAPAAPADPAAGGKGGPA